MARVSGRQEIVDRLQETMKANCPIIGVGAGCGIVAKCAELSKADFIVVSGIFEPWMLGFETRVVVGYHTDITTRMCKEVARVVKETPLIVGFEASDPFNTWEQQLEVAEQYEFSGIANLPTRGSYGKSYNRILGVEHVIRKEAEFLAFAQKRGFFTVAYVYDAIDATMMAEASVDCMVAHVGPTGGGLSGFAPKPLDECFRIVNEIVEATQKVNPDVICLAHGGPFIEPEDTEILYEKTPVAGFMGESSIGRIPVERGVIGAVREFKSVPFKTD